MPASSRSAGHQGHARCSSDGQLLTENGVFGGCGRAQTQNHANETYSKNDFLGQGTDNNIKKCKHDVRLCIPSAFNRLRNMRPAHFGEKNEDASMFTLDSGLVIHKDVICRLLRNGALALGLDPRVVSTHSLRAGGCSAMFNANFPEHEIQRRGRWVSSCWKQYALSSRRKAVDVADNMTGDIDDSLMAHTH